MTDREFNKAFKPGETVLVRGETALGQSQPAKLLQLAYAQRGVFFTRVELNGQSIAVAIDRITKPAGGPTVEQLLQERAMARQHLATIRKYVEAMEEMFRP